MKKTVKKRGINKADTVVQRLDLLPHSKKVFGSSLSGVCMFYMCLRVSFKLVLKMDGGK